MLKLKANKIQDQNQLLAQILKQARQKKGLSRQQAAEQLGVAPKYLDLIEDGRLTDLPAGLYQRLYLKKYLDFLGLPGEVLAKVEISRPAQKILFAPQKIQEKKALLIPQLLKGVLIAVLAIICFFYLQSQFSRAVSAPKLSVQSPPPNLVTASRNLKVEGFTEPETEVVINGQLVLSNQQGRFQQTINLRAGVNTITIVAKKKYGAENKIIRQVLVK